MREELSKKFEKRQNHTDFTLDSSVELHFGVGEVEWLTFTTSQVFETVDSSWFTMVNMNLHSGHFKLPRPSQIVGAVRLHIRSVSQQ